ncbi:MAG TPA: glycosyltransferase family 1 protein [Bacteroidia bacterium]|jgi:glycosyltransferase involved in cell wall biosynthesis|nr:glycosyltransferase family 1 protein [Bacteroidia bacterium]
MKIAVNTRLLLKGKMEGIAVHAYNVLKRITVAHPEHQFLFLFDRPYSEEFIFSNNITPVSLMPQARHPILFYLWFEYSVARVLKQAKPDLFYSPDGFLSLKSDVPSIPVLHDINYEYYPEDLPKIALRYYKHYTPLFLAKAKQVLTVSEFSKQDIVKIYGTDPAKIDVVYNGADSAYTKLNEDEKVAVKQKYSQGKDYFLYVSALHPRKNVRRLLEAFDRMKESSGADIKLVLVGPSYFKNSEMMNVYEKMKHKNDVIFTGRLEVNELCKVVGAAFAMAYVSYFEGFGIPIIEAIQCEVPVITSNVTSMPEVAGNAALLVDPFSVDSIADALLKMYKDAGVRQDLIEKAKLRKDIFTWDRTADLTWKSIEKTLEKCR